MLVHCTHVMWECYTFQAWLGVSYRYFVTCPEKNNHSGLLKFWLGWIDTPLSFCVEYDGEMFYKEVLTIGQVLGIRVHSICQ